MVNKLEMNYLPLLAGILVFLILIVSSLIVFLKMKAKSTEQKGKRAVKYLEKTMCPTVLADTANYEVHTNANATVRIGKVHATGQRDGQQDSFGISDVESEEVLQQKGMLAIIADGMGGLEDGDKVSAIATVSLLRYFDEELSQEHTMDQEFLRMVAKANDEVNDYLGEKKKGKCGTTLISVLVKENQLYWISIGDSGIYLYRNNELTELNEKHIYAVELEEKVKNGEISSEEAMNDPQRAALTSFIGAGDIALINQNQKALELMRGDRILLMSDGVFGTLSNDEISYLMHFNVNESALKMQKMIEEKNKKNQDNYTALIIEYVG